MAFTRTTIDEFAADVRKKFMEDYRRQYPLKEPAPETLRSNDQMRFAPPASYNAHLEHHRNFINAVRTRKPFFEDGVFGFRTAGPALLTGVSYEEKKACGWDPRTLTRTA